MIEGAAEFPAPVRIGRYVIHHAIARGGMATVHLGRLEAEEGFTRIVAIKRLHAQHAHDPSFVASLLDEARLSARIRHPNVVPMLDVVRTGEELCLVMEYVEGLSLSQLMRLLRNQERIALDVAVAIVGGVLRGLHAAHEARSDQGVPLGIVHRDVSPQNTLIGADGVARLIDFGIAKAISNSSTTQSGQIKGKLQYMSPEQMASFPVDRRTDIFAVGAVLWELVVGERLFPGDTPGAIVLELLQREIKPPSQHNPDVPEALDAVVLKALARNPEERYPTCAEMEAALEDAVRPASTRVVGSLVARAGASELERRADLLQQIERGSETVRVDPPVLPHTDEDADATSPQAGFPTSRVFTLRALALPRRTMTIAAGLVILACGAIGVGVVAAGRSANASGTLATPSPIQQQTVTSAPIAGLEPPSPRETVAQADARPASPAVSPIVPAPAKEQTRRPSRNRDVTRSAQPAPSQESLYSLE